MEFNKQATKELNKLLRSVVKELEKIMKLNDNIAFSKTISLPKDEMREACKGLRVDLIYSWNINLDKDYFTLSNGGKTYGTHFTIAQRNSLGKLSLAYDEEDKKVLFVFLKHYPEIREELIKRVEYDKQKRKQEQDAKLEDEEKTLEELRRLKNIYQKQATIEIHMPETNNQHEIEVKEENGQKVGTIKINGMTLKIITSGDVKISNNLEQPKVKRR